MSDVDQRRIVARFASALMALLLALPSPAPRAAADEESNPAARLQALRDRSRQLQRYHRLDDALAAAREATAVARGLHGDSSSEVTSDLRWEVHLHLDRREYDDALRLMEAMLEQHRRLAADRPWLIADDVASLRYIRRVRDLPPAEVELLSEAARRAAAAERLERAGQFEAAAAEFLHAFQERRALLGYSDRVCAELLGMQAHCHARLGAGEQAEAAARASVQAFQELTGQPHRDYAAACGFLAAILQTRDRGDDALPWLRRAAEGFCAVLGPVHPTSRASVDQLAEFHRQRGLRAADAGNYATARDSFIAEVQALQLGGESEGWRSREAELAAAQCGAIAGLTRPQRESLTRALHVVDSTRDDGGADAGPEHGERLTAAAEEIAGLVGKEAPLALAARRRLIGWLQAAGRLDAAATACADLTQTCRTLFGPDAPACRESLATWIEVLDETAAMAAQREDFDSGIALLRRAAPLRTERYGADGWQTVDGRLQITHLESLGNLGQADRLAVQRTFSAMERVGSLTRQGHFAAAQSDAEGVLDVRRRLLGPRSRHVAEALHSLGYLLEQQGDVAAAERAYDEALSLRQDVLGPNHPETAETWNNLGVLHLNAMNAAAATRCFAAATAVWRHAFGPRHPKFAAGLIAQSNVALARRDAVEAEPLLVEAIEILEAHDDEASRDAIARARNNLGGVYAGLGRPQMAAPLYAEAANGWRRLGRLNDLARALDNQAGVLRDAGDWAGTEPLHREALQTFVLVLGRSHRSTTICRTNLATALIALGRFDEALPLARESVAAAQRQFLLTAAAGSERQQIEAFTMLRTHLDAALSAGIPGGERPDRLYALVRAWKGQVLRQQRQRAAIRSDPRFAALVEQVQDATRALSAISLQPSVAEPDRWQASLREAAAERDTRERTLAAAIAGRIGSSLSEEWETPPVPIVPRAAALVDIYEHRRFDPRTRKFSRVLLAFIVRAGGHVELVDLGSSVRMTALVDAWRARYATVAPRAARSDPAVGLVDVLWNRLKEHLAEAGTIYISPDGPLARFPWGALPGEQPGTFLLEERELLLVPHAGAVEAAATLADVRLTAEDGLLVGGVEFGPEPSRGLRFAPLPGTLREVEDIAALAGGGKKPRLLTGSQPSEARMLAELPGTRLLHLATHGFFAPPELRRLIARGDEHVKNSIAQPGGGSLEGWQSTELLGAGVLTGVALADSNRPGGTVDNRWTAAEVAAQNLQAIDLVVLSACDTGIGEAVSGDSVLSLQRAFHAAGCPVVVASLWRLDDEATAALMKLFYYHLWVERKPPGTALREAQLALLRHSARVGDLARTRAPQFDQEVEVVRRPATAKPAADGSPRLWAAFTISVDGEATR